MKNYSNLNEWFNAIMFSCALMIVSLLLFQGCDTIIPTYDKQVEREINSLNPPVILIGKKESLTGYYIIVRDREKMIHYYNSDSGICYVIGSSCEIGDTIR